jgi:vesicle transport through interaction with t-SNAREs 1
LISASLSPPAIFDIPPFVMDTEIGTELFAGYENDFNLIIADISSKLQGLQDQDGEPRKAALRAAERAVEEAEEIVILFR